MNDTWLYAMNLRKNRSKALPIIGEKEIIFDGIDDHVDINNSENVGSPYDFEFNQGFAMAGRVITQSNLQQVFIVKRGGAGNIGYLLQLNQISGLNFNFGIIQSGPVNRAVTANDVSVAQNVPYIFVCGHPPSGGNLFMTIYNANGARISGASVGSGTYNGLTIRNTGKLSFGLNIGGSLPFKGVLSNQCVFNSTMSQAQQDELGLLIAQDRVKNHSLYNSNCVGYWRYYHPKTVLINEVNQTYNGTPINF